MIEIGEFRSRTCGGTTRRSFLRAGAALPFAAQLASEGRVLAAPSNAKAKSVVFVWLWGAPSHLDTFDPKPEAPDAYRGPFANIATRTPGVHFTELLPRTAARSHLFSVVRSHVTHDGAHPGAGTIGFCGYKESQKKPPSFGAIVARHRGSSVLPPYIMLGRGVPRDIQRTVSSHGGGDLLGRAYDPLLVNCKDDSTVEIPSLKLMKGFTPQRLADRRELISQLDGLKRRLPEEQFDEWDLQQQQAYRMLTSTESVNALDLSREKLAAREAYGHTAFGQSLLLARRLVEAEVPYVHVNWSEYVEACTPNTDFGWDTHIYNFDMLPNRHCPIFDRAFSAFLDDLHNRGLLNQTLVVAMGEFGRTPKINKRAARDHWPQCYFSLWAGGGVRAGQVVGASDSKGEHPITRPYDPLAVGTTIAELAGINSVVRNEMNVLSGGEVIHELL